MPVAPPTFPEAERLRALHGYGVMDTPSEAAFDELVAFAARICGTPISLVTLLDRDRQWFKSRYGLELAEPPRDVSFCVQAVNQAEELLIVPDTTLDPRFAGNAFVTGEPGVRFYAGVRLCTPEGHAVGTLSVVDRQPRVLTPDQLEALRVLGRQVMAQLELRRGLNTAALNHARLENSQRIANLGDWEYDFTTQRLVWSEQVYLILGLAREDAAPNSESFYRQVHPDDLAFVHREKLAAAQGLRRVDFEHRIIRPDGEVRFLHQVAELLFDAQGQPLRESGTIQDITERKLADEALRQSEERFRKLLMFSPDAHYAQVDGLITLVNPAFCTLMRATGPEQLIGKAALEVIDPDYHPLVLELRRKHRDNQSVPVSEMKFVRLDGTTVDVEVTGVAFDLHGRKEVHAIARDIGARKASETALRESEERFKFVARAVSDVVWDWDLAANTLWWNDGYLTTFGFTAGEIAPSVESWTGRIHSDDRRRVVASIHQAIDSGAETWTAEYRFQRKDGSYALVQDRGYIIRDATGRGFRMVGGMRDLTEQRKLESQYLRAQRMDSIGTLAGGIAHDLNNVLAPIMMSIELLKYDSGNDAQRGQILDTIQVSCRRGADLVRQVLSFARGVDGQRIAIGLGHLIDELKGIIGKTFPLNIKIVSLVPSDLWPITGDPTQLHQVLLNLAVNARDAMPQGGVLTLTAVNLTIDANYAGIHQDAKAGTYILLEVSDTGHGIPPGVRERIFEPFFTTKAVGKGTGLGLATVHTIVKSHGGFVNVESEVGKGTKFKICLPADPVYRTTDTVHPFHADLPHGQGELILVVDDEFSIRHITQQTLETFGYRVLTAANGTEALKLYAAQAPQIAAVLTDMMMPIMDGAATIQALMRVNPSVRIIAVSGLDSGDTLSKASGASGHVLLAKPYTAQTLVRLVREVLDGPESVAAPVA